MSRTAVALRTALSFSLLLLLPLVATSGAAPAADLRVVRTEHYRIHTDLDDAFAADLARRMDAMYGEYARRLSGFHADTSAAAQPPRLEVYLFRTQAQYLRFTGERFRNTGGVYIPRRNLLAAFLEGQGRDGLRRTLQHEAFHQFAYNAISPNLPVWLNEGMAEVFEEGIWTGDRFLLGQAPPRRIRQLQADLAKNRIIDFATIITMPPERWAANLTGDHDLGATEYTQAWAMVHFLAEARDSAGREKYRGRLINLLTLLHEGRDADAAFKDAFSDNTRGFQDRFTEFARDLRATDEAVMIERQSVLGDLLTELAKRGGRFSTFSQFRSATVDGHYRMHYSKGELEWDTDPDLLAYFADAAGRPLSADELSFVPRTGARLPDIVCRCSARLQLRTRFYANGDRTEHEVLVEPVLPAATGHADAR